MANNSTANFADMINPAVTEATFEEFNRRPHIFSRIFNEQNSDRNSEIFSQLIGFSSAPEKPEGTAVVYEAAVQGYDKTLTHTSYGKGFRITKEMQADDLTGKMMKLPRALGTSMINTVETVAHNLIINGFSTATGGDGSSLFASDHTPSSGGADQSNILATAADLSATSLKDALVAFEDTNDDRGLPLLQNAQTLLVPSGLRYTAQELLKSKQKPGSADNDFNPLAEADLGWMISQYLTDTDAWFLIGDIHFLQFLWRQKPEFDSTMDFDTGDAKFKLTSRFSVGHNDWRGVYGTPGA
jgi:hypothetical protein